jgi:peptidoglycan-associated lipoprotein
MSRKPFFIPIIFFIAAIIALQGCATKNRMGTAKKAYDIGEYHRAIGLLNKALKKEKNRFHKGEISFYMGESYRNINQPRKAATSYGKAIRFGYTDRKSKLYQALSLNKMGSYQEAAVLFEEYLVDTAGDRLAFTGLASARLALNPPPPTRHKVEAVRKLNSRFSDYAPALIPDDPTQIFFSSTRLAKKKKKNLNRITGQGASAIYTSQLNAKGDWDAPTLLIEQIPNANWEDGTISLTEDGKEAFFTRTRYENTGPMGAEIWNIKRMGGRWGEPSRVMLGPDSLVFAHPAISPDGNTLYFVSNMGGGFGGNDIWKTTKSGEEWGVPVNLGVDINTPGDDVFPYIRHDNILFFSSNGLVGYGGLDLYMAEPLEDNKWQVSNLGKPINTMYDDFGITFIKSREIGYFSSSRDNNRGLDHIYAFSLPTTQIVLTGLVDAGDNQPVPENSIVRIVGTDGTNMRIKLEAVGTFNTLLKPDVDYAILIAAPGYFNHREKLSTKGVTDSKQYNLTIKLNSAKRPLVFENIQFESGKWDLSAAARNELVKVAAILNDNPTIKVSILSHTDARGDETENIVISQKRAEAVLEHLVSLGLPTERLSASGVGGTQPITMSADLARKYTFAREKELLNELFIQRLNRRDQETARNLNNRVEFLVQN